MSEIDYLYRIPKSCVSTNERARPIAAWVARSRDTCLSYDNGNNSVCGEHDPPHWVLIVDADVTRMCPSCCPPPSRVAPLIGDVVVALALPVDASKLGDCAMWVATATMGRWSGVGRSYHAATAVVIALQAVTDALRADFPRAHGWKAPRVFPSAPMDDLEREAVDLYFKNSDEWCAARCVREGPDSRGYPDWQCTRMHHTDGDHVAAMPTRMIGWRWPREREAPPRSAP